ncbi:MAG: hypothetical protein Q7R90_01550, partial [bacterium]|nr:hypothetical protein [bacterium]
MVFHESLNQERKFSLAIPLVFIAILGGTTAVLEVATVLSPQASYAVNPQAQLAQGAASSDPKEADKLCPAAKPRESVYAGKSQPKLIKTEVAKNTFVMVENLSWRQCQHTEDTDIAAQGYCIGEDICHADICDSKQCTLRKIPGSGSGAGTGFEGPTAEDLLADIQTNERTVAKLNEEKAQFEASMNAIGSEPFPKESEIKDLEKKVVEQKTAFEQITGMSYDDPSVGKPGDPKNPTEQEMYNQENVAKLRDEQRQLSAELVKDPNNETLLNRQKEISRDLGTQNTFASLKDDSWAGANFNYETPGDQNATKDLNGDWTKDFNFQTAGADALDPSVAKATEDAKGDWTQYDDKSDMGAMGKYLNPQVPPEKPGDWADEKNNYGNPYAPEQTTDPKGSPVPNTSDEDAPPPVGAVVPSCTGKSCDYMVNANDKDMIEGYKAAGLKCGDAIDGAVVCSGAGTGKVTNTRTPGGKVDANGNPVTPPGTKTGGGDATKGGGGGDMGKAFGSLLEGLMKALGAPK